MKYKQTLTNILSASVVLMTTHAHAQSELEIIERAKQHMATFNFSIPEGDQSYREMPSGRPWCVSFWHYSVMMEKDFSLRLLTTPVDAEISMNSNFDPGIPPIAESIILDKARNYLARLTTDPALTAIRITSPANVDDNGRLTCRDSISVLFQTDGKGIYSLGKGNQTSISFDAQSGELVSISHSSGYTYQSLDNLISEESAIQTATAANTFPVPGDKIDRVKLKYMENGYMKDEYETKECIPVYSILFMPSATTIYVDAKTGHVLKIMAWSIGRSSKNKLDSETKQNEPQSSHKTTAIGVKDKALTNKRKRSLNFGIMHILGGSTLLVGGAFVGLRLYKNRAIE